MLAGVNFASEKVKLPEGPAELGFDLALKEATSGWLALFDSQTDYGWANASIANNTLAGGSFSLPLKNCKIRIKSKEKSRISLEGQSHFVNPNLPLIVEASKTGGIFKVESGSITSAAILPLKTTSQFNGRNLKGWKEIIRKGVSPATWKVEDGKLVARGGPACLELENQLFGDMLVRIQVTSKARHANGGLFFRAIPGDFTNGYEAQIYSSCDQNDPGKPTKWATGAIDDRIQARRLISRDFEPFTMTVIANGPNIGVWVNGYQTVSWVDPRPLEENPRKGLRLKPGSIQIQAHDPMTHLEIHELSTSPW